ncbi:hypothetical protein JOB18_022753 [Solea senegalensis]|nr:hypothetical protein JOB18_022753 [Solea senegalensis]
MDEAHAAMEQITGDSCWSCAGENVFDVLLEMEREREKKEKLFWDLQLINAGNVNNIFVMEKPVVTDPHQRKHSHCTRSTHTVQTEKLLEGNEKCERVRSVKRLKRAARQCWIRLASEGVHSILPSPWWRQSLKVKGHAWGCVSLSDAFLLVDVKYDVVTHLLYTEMLVEHHTESVWESLLSWQQHREEEGLEESAEEALESGDMLRLAELPGAFRMYRVCLDASLRSCAEFREQWCSAASLLYETHTCRQQERDKLTELGQRLDRESLKVVCLHIRLATLRAQREKVSYCALLAARQSWETWPRVSGAGGAEQAAALWLHGEGDDDDDELNKDLISVSTQQQAVLQLLMLTQDQERRHLVKLIHGVSLEDLQGPVYTAPPVEEGHNHTALRNSCVKRLRQILTSLQTHSRPQTSTEPHVQAQTDQMQVCTRSEAAVKSQHQLQHCALLLLTQLQELHDLQASALLQVLMDKGEDHLQVLRDEYESELGTRGIANLLQFLISDAALTSSSVFVSENNELQKTPSSTTEVVQSTGSEAAKVLAVFADGDLNEIQAAVMTNQQDVCTDCGFVVEEMPYLEILCVSDAPSKTHQSLTAGREGPQEENGGSATRSPQSYEKQGSLIALAWSKPPEDDDDYDAEAADRVTELSQSCDSSLKAQVQTSDMCSTAEDTQCEETSGDRCDGCHDVNSAEKRELTSEEKSVVDQSCETEAVPERDLQVVQSFESTHHPEMKPHSDDLCSGETSDTAEVDVETCLTATESELLDVGQSTHTQDQKHCSLTTSDFTETPMEREQVKEPVSAMEREQTIRNLVDMQRKVEQRQQRDRERQLLRVRERLSIIQSRKAEEDLLGLKVTDELRHLTQGLPQEDKNRQKTVVRERLEQLRRERSYVLQSKRDRNTAGFKELLGPVALSRETEDEGD